MLSCFFKLLSQQQSHAVMHSRTVGLPRGKVWLRFRMNMERSVIRARIGNFKDAPQIKTWRRRKIHCFQSSNPILGRTLPYLFARIRLEIFFDIPHVHDIVESTQLINPCVMEGWFRILRLLK
jgi:hypothetical protein